MMMNFFENVATFFYTPAGNIAFHIALGFSIAGALYSALKNWQRKKYPQGYRMIIGLGFLLVIRLIILLGCGIVGLEGSRIPMVLHVLNRAVDTLGLIFIFWMWAFPEPHKTADWVVSGLSLITFALLLSHALSTAVHANSFLVEFSWIQLAWTSYGLILILAGCLLLLQRKPNGREYGWVMGAILGAGYVFHLLEPGWSAGFSGHIRLAHLIAYPLLMTLPFRFTGVTSSPPQISQPPEQEPGRRRSAIDLSVLKAIIQFSPRAGNHELYRSIVKLTSLAIVADICLLVEAPDPQQKVDVLSGFDLIRQEHIPGFTVESKRIPLLTTFIRREQTLHLPASTTSRDLINLSHALQLRQSGHLLATPIKFPDTQAPKGLVLLSPFSERQWIKKDQEFLNQLVNILTDTLHAHSDGQEPSPERLKHSLKTLKERYESERDKNQTLRQEIEKLRQRQLQSSSMVDVSTNDLVQHLRQENKALNERVERLSEVAFAESDSELRSQLRLALEEIAALKKDLSQTEKKLEVLPKKQSEESSLTKIEQHALTSFAQEVQEPLRSFLQESDIFLEQSIHTLNTIQKQMLQRMKRHREQISQIMRDTMQDMQPLEDAGRGRVYPADFKTSLNTSLKAIKEQIQGKDISLKIDLPRNLIPIDMPQDVLNDILIILMANAAHETPHRGHVVLKLRVYKEASEQSFAHIQIADEGEGYMKSELPYVIEHRENDREMFETGEEAIRLDLASVRDMVEDHDGRIWVDSEPRRGTIISILLPFVPQRRLKTSRSST